MILDPWYSLRNSLVTRLEHVLKNEPLPEYMRSHNSAESVGEELQRLSVAVENPDLYMNDEMKLYDGIEDIFRLIASQEIHSVDALEWQKVHVDLADTFEKWANNYSSLSSWATGHVPSAPNRSLDYGTITEEQYKEMLTYYKDVFAYAKSSVDMTPEMVEAWEWMGRDWADLWD